jgi:signal peptidase II
LSSRQPLNKATLTFLGVALSIVFFDQLTKTLALEYLELYQPRPVIGELLQFTLAFNDRAAFSIGGANTWIFGPKFKTKSWLLLGGIALGGVTGNLIDRLFREPSFANGHVVDFIQIPFNFPIFNIADMAISSAAFLIALKVIRGEKFGGSK